MPVREDAALVEALSALELGTEIGEELYAVVAEALAWAYKLDRRARRRRAELSRKKDAGRPEGRAGRPAQWRSPLRRPR